jgi:hypothetical protein
MSRSEQTPEFVLFGDSLTEWGFDSTTEGFGLYLEEQYRGKLKIVNQGELYVPRYSGKAEILAWS